MGFGHDGAGMMGQGGRGTDQGGSVEETADERALAEMAVVENGSREGRAERGGPRGAGREGAREGRGAKGISRWVPWEVVPRG